MVLRTSAQVGAVWVGLIWVNSLFVGFKNLVCLNQIAKVKIKAKK